MIIIGGGISGLTLAFLLNNLNISVIILEKNKYPGGKLQTEYDQSESVMYEKGSWRISYNHHNIISLCNSLDIEIKPMDYEYIYNSNGIIYSRKLPKRKNKIDGVLSVYDEWILETDKTTSDKIESMTGYNNILNMSNGINAYEAMPSDYNYGVIDTGFSSIIKKLIDYNKYEILTEFNVINVKKINSFYEIDGLYRTNYTFQNIKLKTKTLIIACPPISIIDWDISSKFKTILNSITNLSLHHIYGYSNEKPMIKNLEKFHMTTENPLSQVISSAYNNKWFQISYSSGRLADFWFHLSLKNEKQFHSELIKNLNNLIDSPIKISKIKNYYWEQAIHMWKPSFNFNILSKLLLALIPHPVQLPNLYMIGEFFSQNQGWCEGALETVYECFKYLTNEKKILGKLISKEDCSKLRYVIYQDRILDVGKWMHKHPGGIEPIQNHLNQDITDLWNSIHQSEYSQMMISSIQIGWVFNNKFYYLNNYLG